MGQGGKRVFGTPWWVNGVVAVVVVGGVAVCGAICVGGGREVRDADVGWLPLIVVLGVVLTIVLHEGAHMRLYMAKGVRREDLEFTRWLPRDSWKPLGWWPRRLAIGTAVGTKVCVPVEAVRTSLWGGVVVAAIDAGIAALVASGGGACARAVPQLALWGVVVIAWGMCVGDVHKLWAVRKVPPGTLFKDEGERLVEC